MEITPLSKASSATAVRNELVAMIKAHRFPVGTKLPGEIRLAQSFGVSRPVVREALGGLRAAGLIESRAGAGTFVINDRIPDTGLSLLGTTNSAELHEVRTHLEVPGAGLAATRRSSEQLEKLRAIVEEGNEDDDIVEWVRGDLRFHITIAEMTGNTLHTRLISELRELQFEQSVQMARMMGGLGAPIAEHGAIFEAIRDGDAERASRAMTEHLDAIRERVQIAQSFQERS
ncbi:FadR/GntR family transcriptional regulator [Streptomyces sp. ISID311]|uniref:FadR/GntR family transcriptional regulator n=1 Tax=Streptomyces sp. ISID311 TaxID=2601673 RepID=UPI00164A429C|nr:FadR/GntR family transcriptional regulator [Streptomyces sp. ISID311]